MDHLVIPLNQISPDTLEGIIEDYVLREGTEYGHADYSLEQKKQAVEKQLRTGTAQIVFDPKEETCSIIKI